jgi:hypothetical protein
MEGCAVADSAALLAESDSVNAVLSLAESSLDALKSQLEACEDDGSALGKEEAVSLVKLHCEGLDELLNKVKAHDEGLVATEETDGAEPAAVAAEAAISARDDAASILAAIPSGVRAVTAVWRTLVAATACTRACSVSASKLTSSVLAVMGGPILDAGASGVAKVIPEVPRSADKPAEASESDATTSKPDETALSASFLASWLRMQRLIGADESTLTAPLRELGALGPPGRELEDAEGDDGVDRLGGALIALMNTWRQVDDDPDSWREAEPKASKLMSRLLAGPSDHGAAGDAAESMSASGAAWSERGDPEAAEESGGGLTASGFGFVGGEASTVGSDRASSEVAAAAGAFGVARLRKRKARRGKKSKGRAGRAAAMGDMPMALLQATSPAAALLSIKDEGGARMGHAESGWEGLSDETLCQMAALTSIRLSRRGSMALSLPGEDLALKVCDTLAKSAVARAAEHPEADGDAGLSDKERKELKDSLRQAVAAVGIDGAKTMGAPVHTVDAALSSDLRTGPKAEAGGRGGGAAAAAVGDHEEEEDDEADGDKIKGIVSAKLVAGPAKPDRRRDGMAFGGINEPHSMVHGPSWGKDSAPPPSAVPTEHGGKPPKNAVQLGAERFDGKCFYFECEILSTGRTGESAIAVGLCATGKETGRGMLGWSQWSVGYHSDDGGLFGSLLGCGPKYDEGDVVGIYWIPSLRCVGVTLNGVDLGPRYLPAVVDSASSLWGKGLRPSVSMHKGAMVALNFGGAVAVADPGTGEVRLEESQPFLCAEFEEARKLAVSRLAETMAERARAAAEEAAESRAAAARASDEMEVDSEGIQAGGAADVGREGGLTDTDGTALPDAARLGTVRRSRGHQGGVSRLHRTLSGAVLRAGGADADLTEASLLTLAFAPGSAADALAAASSRLPLPTAASVIAAASSKTLDQAVAAGVGPVELAVAARLEHSIAGAATQAGSATPITLSGHDGVSTSPEALTGSSSTASSPGLRGAAGASLHAPSEQLLSLVTDSASKAALTAAHLLPSAAGGALSALLQAAASPAFTPEAISSAVLRASAIAAARSRALASIASHIGLASGSGAASTAGGSIANKHGAVLQTWLWAAGQAVDSAATESSHPLSPPSLVEAVRRSRLLLFDRACDQIVRPGGVESFSASSGSAGVSSSRRGVVSSALQVWRGFRHLPTSDARLVLQTPVFDGLRRLVSHASLDGVSDTRTAGLLHRGLGGGGQARGAAAWAVALAGTTALSSRAALMQSADLQAAMADSAQPSSRALAEGIAGLCARVPAQWVPGVWEGVDIVSSTKVSASSNEARAVALRDSRLSTFWENDIADGRTMLSIDFLVKHEAAVLAIAKQMGVADAGKALSKRFGVWVQEVLVYVDHPQDKEKRVKSISLQMQEHDAAEEDDADDGDSEGDGAKNKPKKGDDGAGDADAEAAAAEDDDDDADDGPRPAVGGGVAFGGAAGHPGMGGMFGAPAAPMGAAAGGAGAGDDDDDDADDAAEGNSGGKASTHRASASGPVATASPSKGYKGWIRLPLPHPSGAGGALAVSPLVALDGAVKLRLKVEAAARQCRIRSVRVVAALCALSESGELHPLPSPPSAWLLPLRAPALQLFRSLAGAAIDAVAAAARASSASSLALLPSGAAGAAVSAQMSSALLGGASSAARQSGLRTLAMIAKEVPKEATRLRLARAAALKAALTDDKRRDDSCDQEDEVADADKGSAASSGERGAAKRVGASKKAAAASAAGAEDSTGAEAASKDSARLDPANAEAVAAAADVGVDDSYAFELVEAINGLSRELSAAISTQTGTDSATSWQRASASLGPLDGTLCGGLMSLLLSGTARVQRSAVRALGRLLPLSSPDRVDAACAPLLALEGGIGSLAGAVAVLVEEKQLAVEAAATKPPSQAQDSAARHRGDSRGKGSAIALLLLVAGAAHSMQIRGSAAGRTVKVRGVAGASAGLVCAPAVSASAEAQKLLRRFASGHVGPAQELTRSVGQAASKAKQAAAGAESGAASGAGEDGEQREDAAPGLEALLRDLQRLQNAPSFAAATAAAAAAAHSRAGVEEAADAPAPDAPVAAWPALLAATASSRNEIHACGEAAMGAVCAAARAPDAAAVAAGVSATRSKSLTGRVAMLVRAVEWAGATRAMTVLSIAAATSRLAGLAKAPARAMHSPAVWMSMGAMSLAGQASGWVSTELTAVLAGSHHDETSASAAAAAAAAAAGTATRDPILPPLPTTGAGSGSEPGSELRAVWQAAMTRSAASVKTELSWLRATVFTATRNAVIEVRRDPARAARGEAEAERCRFCQCELTPDRVPSEPAVHEVFSNVCKDAMCQESAAGACTHMLACGHACGGVRGEKEHLPCYQGCDGVAMDGEDMCATCVDRLDAAPSVRLGGCGHVIHADCAKQQIAAGWPGARITLRYLGCPLCSEVMDHPALEDAMADGLGLRASVHEKARMRIQYMGLEGHAAVTDATSRFFKKPVEYALSRFAYYRCHECGDPYYGGEVQCDAADADRDIDETELVCPKCQPFSAEACSKHGLTTWKCRCEFPIASFGCRIALLNRLRR